MGTRDSKLQKSPTVPIDWNKIHLRLEASAAAAHNAWQPDAMETARILKERAQVLAHEPASEAVAEHMEVVEFLLACETYAIESCYVREVYPLENLTTLPRTPSFVLGIVNVRGEILSVIDIRKFFDLPEKGLTDLNKLIVLDSGAMRFGILADSISGVCYIPLAEIQPSLPTLTGIREKYLKGITVERTIVLDAQKLIADEKIVVQEQP